MGDSVDVSAVGTLAVDYFALVPKIPSEEEKIMATGYEIHPGGVAGNVLTQLARLGVNAGWIGKLGDDESGKILIEEFKKEKIDYSHAEVVEKGFSMFTWIQVDSQGNRAITMFPNVLIELTADDVKKKHAEYIRTSKIFQAEICVMPLEPVIASMEIARDSGVITVLDLDVPISYFTDEAGISSRDKVFRAISLADVIIPCKDAAKELLNSENFEKDIEKLLELGPKIAAITLGKDGCVVTDGDKKVVVPGFKVEVVDTTGAGDAFHGGFIYGLLKGYPIEDAGRIANACGAYCCTKVGARASGGLDEINNILSQSN